MRALILEILTTSSDNLSFLFDSEKNWGHYYHIIYYRPHTQKQTLAKSKEKLSEIDIALSEQLMNPIRGWNFLRDAIRKGRATVLIF